MHLVIAPFLEQNEDYAQFYTETDGYIIVDNGAYEMGKSCDFGIVIDQAKEIGASEIVLPDVIMDREKSLELIDEAYHLLSSNEMKDFKFMCALQGKDINDVFKYYFDVIHLIAIDVIAFPVWMDRKWGIRAALTKYLRPEIYDEYEIHMLGLTRPDQVLTCDPKVRSADSSLAWRLASRGIVADYRSLDLSRFDWNMKLTDEKVKIAIKNHEMIQGCMDANVKAGL